jgi:tight adherence protein B
MVLALAATLLVLFIGGAVLVYADGGNERSQKRLAAYAKPGETGGKGDPGAQRKRNMQTALKEFDKKQAEKKKTLTLRRRLDQAGFTGVSERNFWLASGAAALVAVLLCLFKGQSLIVMGLAGFAIGFGLPRWLLSFLKARREKKFTEDFASAIDVIVRSVKSGLPTTDALRIVAREFSDPVGGEFMKLVEGMKVGVTLEQGLKKMYDNMPTAEVSFFAIVLTIQQKTGGNLSEALGNLAAVLRDRKRLKGKIKAMSGEAKASAMIIGALPPGVATIVYMTTPAYIVTLFTTHTGNLMLAGCVLWMGLGIFVMRKMINFRH